MLSRIKKDDTVIVISGKDKGKQGSVVIVDKKKNKALVKGVNVITRHHKARRQGEKSGIVKEEAFVRLDKMMPLCKKCNKGARIQIKQEGTKKLRMCHRCHAEF